MPAAVGRKGFVQGVVHVAVRAAFAEFRRARRDDRRHGHALFDGQAERGRDEIRIQFAVARQRPVESACNDREIGLARRDFTAVGRHRIERSARRDDSVRPVQHLLDKRHSLFQHENPPAFGEQPLKRLARQGILADFQNRVRAGAILKIFHQIIIRQSARENAERFVCAVEIGVERRRFGRGDQLFLRVQ